MSARDAEPADSTHQQLAGYLAPRRHNLILAEAGLHQIGDEQLETVGWTWGAGWAETRREYELLCPDFLHSCGSLLYLHPPPVAHPCQMRLRPHECTHGAQF